MLYACMIRRLCAVWACKENIINHSQFTHVVIDRMTFLNDDVPLGCLRTDISGILTKLRCFISYSFRYHSPHFIHLFIVSIFVFMPSHLFLSMEQVLMTIKRNDYFSPVAIDLPIHPCSVRASCFGVWLENMWWRSVTVEGASKTFIKNIHYFYRSSY